MPEEKCSVASSRVTLGRRLRMRAISGIPSDEEIVLPEMNPETDDRRDQDQAEYHIHPMLGRSLRRRFVIQNSHGGDIHLVVDRRKSQAGKFLPFRGRRHQAHGDQHDAADHKHQNRIMQKIHVHQAAQKGLSKA